MLFAELCKEKYTVFENKAMFNGWDADVILPELRIAVLWNGPWHYKKITRKHSLTQVQNRDRIKQEEIKKLGYTAYVIRDDGKFNKEFVTTEFNKFQQYCELNAAGK